MLDVPKHSVPSVVQAFQLYSNPLEFLNNCFDNYGPIFELTPLGKKRPLYFILDPEMIEEIHDEFPDSDAHEMEVFFGDSAVLTSKKTKHSEIRKILMPYFSKKNIKKLSLKKFVEDTFKKYENAAGEDNGVVGEVLTMEILEKVIGEYFLNGQSEESFANFLDLCRKTNKLGHFIVSLETIDLDVVRKVFNKKYNELYECYRGFDEFIESVRSAGASSNDMISYLIKNDVSTKDIRHFIIELVGTTVETLNVSVLWMFYYFGTQRDQVEKIAKCPDGMQKKRAADHFIKEVLRLRPTVPVYDRSVDYDVIIQGYNLRKNARALFVPYHLHQSTFENAKEFLPERFETPNYSKYEYMPFGSGHRFCLGVHLAMALQREVMEQMLEFKHFKLVQEESDKNYRIRLLNLAPKDHYSYQYVL